MSPRMHATLAALTLIALCCAHAATAQGTAAAADTEFWFAPPDLTDLHNSPGGEPIYLHIVSGDSASTVTVSQPANAGFAPIVVNVDAHSSRPINLTPFKSMLETRPTNTILNTGLHVQATTPVTAFYEIANTNNAGFWNWKGRDALGHEFFIPHHRHAPFNNEPSFSAPHQAIASFDLVATQDGTTVSVYSPTTLDGHAPLQQFSLSLNAGQTYSAGFTGTNFSQPATHASGAIVLADKPVAITLKDDSIHNPSGGCYDAIGDQIVPIAALGTDYIAVKGGMNNTGDESVVLVATENNTQIFVDGNAAPVATLFAGEYHRIDLDYLASSPNNAIHVHATRPLYAMHISGFGCEAGAALLPPLQRAGSRIVDLVRPDSQAFYVHLVVPSDAIDHFTVLGAGTATINPASFVTVPGTNGQWHAARLQFNTTQVPVDTALRISNDRAHFAAAIINGGASSGTRYGYLSDFVADIGITATKLATPSTLPEPGGNATFVVDITNSGSAPVQLTTLVDEQAGSLAGRGNCSLPQTIAIGAGYQCSYNTAIVGDAGDLHSATLSALGISLDAAVQATAGATVSIDDVAPSLALAYSAQPAVVAAGGDPATWQVVVQNTSTAEALQLSTLSDDVFGNLAGLGDCTLPQTLAAGASYSCSVTAAVAGTLGDVIVHTVSATLTDNDGGSADSTASAQIAIGSALFGDGFE